MGESTTGRARKQSSASPRKRDASRLCLLLILVMGDWWTHTGADGDTALLSTECSEPDVWSLTVASRCSASTTPGVSWGLDWGRVLQAELGNSRLPLVNELPADCLLLIPVIPVWLRPLSGTARNLVTTHACYPAGSLDCRSFAFLLLFPCYPVGNLECRGFLSQLFLLAYVV